jgi:hypothetical protein
MQAPMKFAFQFLLFYIAKILETLRDIMNFFSLYFSINDEHS